MYLPKRKQKWNLGVLAGTAVLSAGMLLGSFQVSADSISDLKQQYAALQQQQQQLQSQLNTKNSALKTEQAKQAAINSEITTIQEQLGLLKAQIDSVNAQIAGKEKDITATEQRVQQNYDLLKQRLRAMYMSGNDTFLTVLLNSNNMDDFLSRVEMVRAVSNHDNQVIENLKQNEEQLKADRSALDQSKKSLLQMQGAAAAKQDILTSQLSAQSQAVAQAEASATDAKQQTASINAQASQTDDQINAAIAAQAAAARAAASSATNVVTKGSFKNMTALVSYAEQFVGYRYVLNTAGPSTFDCSGFVMYVYAHAAGIPLPHSSAGQAGYGSSVSKSALQPGDLVFFHVGGRGIDHVGIYIGGGQMINAEKPGVGVAIANINSGYWAPKFAGAQRILS